MDGFVAWGLRQQAEWRNEIALLEGGVKTTFDVRNGQRVDTTEETLNDRRVRLADLDALIDKHEVARA